MASFCEGECMGCSTGDEPLTLSKDATVVGCHRYMKQMKDGSPSMAKSTT